MSAFGNHKIRGWVCRAGLGLSGWCLAVAADVKPLASYPKVERMWMGLEEGSIRPAAYEQIRASTEGYMALHAKDGQLLKKHEAWATLDPQQLAIEQRTLDVDEIKLEQHLKKSREEARDLRLRVSLELHETERKRSDILNASQEPEMPVELKKRAAEALTKIDQQLKLLNEKLDPANEKRDMQLEIDDGQLQIERKRKQFLALEKRSHLVAGFAGELRLSEGFKKAIAATASPEGLVWVKPNEHLATIVDDQLYEISVTATSPLLAEIPRAELLVFIQEGQTGSLIGGEYARTDEIDSGSEIVQNYIFTIGENYVKVARHSMGQRNLVHVYRKFTTPFRLIHKKDIAFLAPEVLAASGWDGLVRHLWPGSEVIQVGPQTIAVKAQDGN